MADSAAVARFRQRSRKSRCTPGASGVEAGHVVNRAKSSPGEGRSPTVGAALYQEITIKDGRTVETNFDTYEMMRLAEFPRVETVIVPSGGFWGGIGEPTISVASPAVMNAIFAATGQPVRSLPLKNVKLQKA